MPKIPFLFQHNLIYIPVTLRHAGQTLVFNRCIVDTGAAGTTFEASRAEEMGILPAEESIIRYITTVGGSESVYTRTIDKIQIGSESLDLMNVEFGDLETKFHIDGIIGNDLLGLFKLEICYQTRQLRFERYK